MNFKSELNYGFTLIELLIVIAIIGILAAVLIPNLMSAKDKANDAAIKAQLKATIVNSQIYYQNHGNSYSGICDSGAGGIYETLLSAVQKNTASVSIVSDYWYAYSYNDFAQNIGDGSVCHVDTNGTAWAAVVSLKRPTLPGGGWCVDSTGVSKEISDVNGSVLNFDAGDLDCS